MVHYLTLKETMLELHQRFVSVRQKAAMSRNGTARALKISRPHLVDIETGKVSPRHSFILTFAAYFNVDKNWMLTGCSIKNNDTLDTIRGLLNEKEY